MSLLNKYYSTKRAYVISDIAPGLSCGVQWQDADCHDRDIDTHMQNYSSAWEVHGAFGGWLRTAHHHDAELVDMPSKPFHHEMGPVKSTLTIVLLCMQIQAPAWEACGASARWAFVTDHHRRRASRHELWDGSCQDHSCARPKRFCSRQAPQPAVPEHPHQRGHYHCCWRPVRGPAPLQGVLLSLAFCTAPHTLYRRRFVA